MMGTARMPAHAQRCCCAQGDECQALHIDPHQAYSNRVLRERPHGPPARPIIVAL